MATTATTVLSYAFKQNTTKYKLSSFLAPKFKDVQWAVAPSNHHFLSPYDYLVFDKKNTLQNFRFSVNSTANQGTKKDL